MLLDEIKRQMMAAMKAHDTVRKEILRVALGELSMAAERAGGTLADEPVQGILRKLVKSNQDTLALTVDPAQQETLRKEIAVLEELLPKTLDADGIVALLEPVRDAIRAAANDGQATGVAMKHLKTTGAAVQGKDVGDAVRRIRA
ncbi:MAG: GatB/YqeY domain-containing protein [Deltaproteobacteria bacterium]|jgi:uncharacterized protein YqeY|nr:GatB/YqeY domain-containing protein [Deltaproteobacteria bacterium]MBK7066169.1 GatB/YqeY domain-containing protein [Deltaproteobacteria bacterium]MBK8696451.1 GatB/YqeY domain-containing protein [Deltaproteobacteria bacterium]MBP6833006.1 GatB/YqeY domain-containing protein [Deltaproteobacteria bacterium]